MIFALEALEAKHGDCLILHFGTRQEPRFILIDGGPSGGFRSTLARPAAMVGASVPQGRRLRGQAEALGWQVNRPFPQVVMLEKAGPRRVLFEGGLTLTVLGPSAPRL